MSNENENQPVTDESTTDVVEDSAPVEPTESPAEPTESPAEDAVDDAVSTDAYDPNPVEAAAHLVGISTPADEHHESYTDTARDQLSDEQLLAMGIEPDAGPTRSLVWTFVAMVVVIIVTGIGVAQLYQAVNNYLVDQANTRVDGRLAEVRAQAEAVVSSYEALEAGEERPNTTYRVPVEQGMDILLNDPTLLARHPLAPEPEPEVVPPTEQMDAVAPEGSGEMAGEPGADTANAGAETGTATNTDADTQ